MCVVNTVAAGRPIQFLTVLRGPVFGPPSAEKNSKGTTPFPSLSRLCLRANRTRIRSRPSSRPSSSTRKRGALQEGLHPPPSLHQPLLMHKQEAQTRSTQGQAPLFSYPPRPRVNGMRESGLVDTTPVQIQMGGHVTSPAVTRRHSSHASPAVSSHHAMQVRHAAPPP